jgi:hypothetical protein
MLGWLIIAVTGVVFTWITPTHRQQIWIRVCAAVAETRARLTRSSDRNGSETDLAIATALAAADDFDDDAEYERDVAETLKLSVKQNKTEELRRRRTKQRAETERLAAEQQQKKRDRAIPVLRKLKQEPKSSKKVLMQRSKYEDKLQSAIHRLGDQPNVLKLLMTIVQAVLLHPDEPKYRRLSLQNNEFKAQLSGNSGEPNTATDAVVVLRLLGFKPVGQTQIVLQQVSAEHLAFGCRCLILQLTIHASRAAYESHFAGKEVAILRKVPREPTIGAAGTTKVTVWIEILATMKQAGMQTNEPALDAAALAALVDGGMWRRRVGDEMEGEGGAVNVAALATSATDTGSSRDGKVLVTGRGGYVKFVRHFHSDCKLQAVLEHIASLQLVDMYLGPRRFWTIHNATIFPHSPLFLGEDKTGESDQQLTQTLQALRLWPSAQLLVASSMR